MVGMSGKSSEPRGSSGNARRQQSSQNAPSTKPQPSAEALHLARILEGSSYPADMKDRIQQVVGVVPNKSEEEVCIALHDHDYDPERAITSLLDTDVKQGEWTTSGRKGKKKGSSDAIVAPGDSSSSGGGGAGGTAKTSGGTSRAASTRDNYGGGVTVTRDKGRGRGRSNYARGRGDRGRGDKPRQPSSKSGSKKDDPPPPTAAPEVTEGESWDQSEEQVQTVSQQQQQPPPPPELEVAWDQEQGQLEWDKPSQEPVLVLEREEVAPPIFPEALPTQTLAVTTTAVCVVSHTSPLEICIPNTDDVIQDIIRTGSHTEAKSKKLKQKRLARSQIPSKPVEMPQGMASIDAQFSTLGIDFLGAGPSQPEEAVKVEAPPTTVSYPNTRQQQSSDRYVVPHQQLAPPPVVLTKDLPPPSVLLPTPLTLQPVLVAPDPISLPPASSRAQQPQPGASGLACAAAPPLKEVPREPATSEVPTPSPVLLPQPQVAADVHRPAPSSSSTPSAAVSSFPDQVVRASLQISAPAAVPSSSVAMTSGLPLPGGGHVPMGNMLHPQPSPVALLSSSTGGVGYLHPAASSQGSTSSALLQGSGKGMGLQATAHTSAQAAAHTTAQTAVHTSTVHTAKHSQGPPGFPVFSGPVLQPYYMPNMTGYYTTPPEQVARYPYFHQQASDPSIGTAITREHMASNFGEQSKYVTRAGEGSSPVVSNQSHQQQQQQQGLQAQLGPAAFMNMPSYPQNPYGYFYPAGPWYPQLAKPTNNTFTGNAYQTHHGNLTGYEEVSGHEFTPKSYNASATLGKPVADSDLSAAFKPPYDNKSAGGNNFNYLLQMPPMQMMAQQQQQHESMQSRGQQQGGGGGGGRHSNKPTAYGGWPQSTHNS